MSWTPHVRGLLKGGGTYLRLRLSTPPRSLLHTLPSATFLTMRSVTGQVYLCLTKSSRPWPTPSNIPLVVGKKRYGASLSSSKPGSASSASGIKPVF